MEGRLGRRWGKGGYVGSDGRKQRSAEAEVGNKSECMYVDV